MPAVECVGGRVPKLEPRRRVVESGIVIVKPEVFCPELEAEIASERGAG
jgi:hypothetical protein